MNDRLSLTGRTAIVTGGSRAIGCMIAEGFLRHGAARGHSLAQGQGLYPARRPSYRGSGLTCASSCHPTLCPVLSAKPLFASNPSSVRNR